MNSQTSLLVILVYFCIFENGSSIVWFALCMSSEDSLKSYELGVLELVYMLGRDAEKKRTRGSDRLIATGKLPMSMPHKLILIMKQEINSCKS